MPWFSQEFVIFATEANGRKSSPPSGISSNARSGTYEWALGDARQTAVAEMTDEAASLGANAVVGVDINYETMGSTAAC